MRCARQKKTLEAQLRKVPDRLTIYITDQSPFRGQAICPRGKEK